MFVGTRRLLLQPEPEGLGTFHTLPLSHQVLQQMFAEWGQLRASAGGGPRGTLEPEACLCLIGSPQGNAQGRTRACLPVCLSAHLLAVSPGRLEASREQGCHLSVWVAQGLWLITWHRGEAPSTKSVAQMSGGLVGWDSVTPVTHRKQNVTWSQDGPCYRTGPRPPGALVFSCQREKPG